METECSESAFLVTSLSEAERTSERDRPGAANYAAIIVSFDLRRASPGAQLGEFPESR